jgi:hypothetical protein
MKMGLKERILNWLREHFAPIEIYKKIESPADTLEVPIDIKRENAELQRELLKARKKIEELEEQIRILKGEKEKEKAEEIMKQAEVFKRMESNQSFKWYIIPEVPLRVTSIWSHKEFTDEYGNELPYLVGFKFIQEKEGVYVQPLLSTSPLKFFKKPKVFAMNDAVPLGAFPLIFSDEKEIVSWMKEGRLRINFNEDGKFIPPYLVTETSEVVEGEAKKRGKEKS